MLHKDVEDQIHLDQPNREVLVQQPDSLHQESWQDLNQDLNQGVRTKYLIWNAWNQFNWSLDFTFFKTKPDAPDAFDEIRNYYGEQIALYFRFLIHFQRWTIPMGLIGLLLQV